MINATMKGDIISLFLSGEYDYLVHGCNCFCTMGAGLAKTIKDKFPEAYEADLKTKPGDVLKLGNYTHCETPYGVIINLYTQFNYGKYVTLNYDDIINGFRKLNRELPKGSKILIPRIGAGLAKGNWNFISKLINNTTSDLDITLVKYWR